MKKILLIIFCMFLCSCGNTAVSETAPTEITTTQTAESKAVELDSSVVFREKWYENDSLLSKPMFVAQPEGTDCAVYVMSEDYDDIENSQYVIIGHDGTADKIQTPWIERFRTAFDVYSWDFEKDGKNEIVTVRYAAGGTYCCIEELAVYKEIDGHYICSIFNHDGALDKIVRWQCENGALIMNAEGFEAETVFDLSPFTSSGECEIDYGNVYYYDVTETGVKMTAHLFIVAPEAAFPAGSVLLDMDIDFIDGEFVCSNPVFSLENEE